MSELTCILGKSITSALTDSIPIVDCRNAERPFVKLKIERQREEKSRAQLNTLHCHIGCCSCHFKRVVEQREQNACIETHMPVVKYIPHEYRLSKETAHKSKRLCQNCFIFFGGLCYDVSS